VELESHVSLEGRGSAGIERAEERHTDRKRFTFGSSDTGEIHCSGTYGK